MTKTANLADQLNAQANGLIIDSQGQNDECYNFYDWFCKDSSLQNKSWKLMKQVKTFLKHNPQIDLLTHYVFFKNNCPMNGPLYDDFRICNIETGNVVYTVTPKCGHSGLAEIWGRENDFKGPIKTAKTFSKLFS
jgi:hypothetical protein